MTEATLSKKADLALSDLTSNGGILLPEQNDTFIRVMMDTPTILNECRVVPMHAPQMKINKLGIGSRILHAATQTGGMQDSGANTRWLASANRTKPDLSQVELTTSEVIAEVRLPYETLEDNIEGMSMADTILTMIAQRAALDLEELMITGDTASGDAYLALQNGILKLANAHIVDAANAPIDLNVFNSAKLALPTKYRRNLAGLRYYFSLDTESNYRVKVASRGTGLGDAAATTNNPIPVLGIPLTGVALMPTANGLLTDPQNLIFGIQRNIRIEQDRDIRAREVVIVLTARVAVQIEQTDAVAQVTNLG